MKKVETVEDMNNKKNKSLNKLGEQKELITTPAEIELTTFNCTTQLQCFFSLHSNSSRRFYNIKTSFTLIQ